jgi:hypothetical protein
MHLMKLVVTATVATLTAAVPASAEVFHFEDHLAPVTESYDCGAVLVFTTDVDGRAVVDGNDRLVRVVEQFRFTGTITHEGKTYRANDRQTATTWVSRDDVLTSALNGQGLFTVFPGLGQILDVGHLVFREETGETLLDSAKVVGLDEPFDFGAEVCALLTS